MKRYTNIFASILAVAMLLSGCAKQESTEPVNPLPLDKEKQKIEFRFFVDEGTQIIPYEDYWNAVNIHSRASGSDLPAEFTLYGAYNTVDVPDGTGATTSTEAAPVNKRFFNGIKINRDGTYTGERRYWVADGKTRHTFAAVAGEGNTAVTKLLEKGFTTDVYVPAIYERMEANPKLQKDLLVAYGPTNVIVDGVTPVVNIYFKHAMAKLLFKISTTGGTALYDCVLNIKYNTVYCDKIIYYTGKIYLNTMSMYDNVNYNLNDAMIIPATASSEENAIELGDMKVHSYNQAASWITLTLSYAKIEGGAKTTLKTRLPAIDQQSGMQYTYFLYVSELTEALSITDITVEPWTTEIRVADPLN